MQKRVIFLVLAVAVLFFACSSSDDDEVESWMVDSWLEDDSVPDADTQVLKVEDDGSFTYFVDYAETYVAATGTFKIDGNTITYDTGTSTGTAQYAKISDNEWTWTEDGDITYYYRKSAYPAP